MFASAEQKNTLSSSETITMTFSKEDFICPISRQLLLDPVMAYPCGHIFEEDMITTWRENNDTCPCCRTEIKKVFQAPPFFINMLDELLKKHPSLQNERYFSLESFADLLVEENSEKLRKKMAFLKISEKHMNAISEEKNYEGITAATYLVASDEGLMWLIMDPELRAKITEEGLNAIQLTGDDKGISGVFWLIENGIELLWMDAEFRGKIQVKGLNATNQERGLSPVCKLVEKGLRLVCADAELRGKIQAEGLNTIGKEEDNDGLSAVYWLTKEEKGRKLLLEDARLRSLISKEALNAVVQVEGTEKGKSPAYWLRNTPDGQELLKMDPELNEKLEIEKKEEASHHEVEVKEMTPSAARSPTFFSAPEAVQDEKKSEPEVNFTLI